MSLTRFLNAFISIRGISIYFHSNIFTKVGTKNECIRVKIKKKTWVKKHASELAYCCSDQACDLEWHSNSKKKITFLKIITTDISCVMGLWVTMFLYVPYMNTFKNINILIPTKFLRIQQTWHLKFIKKV